MVTPYYLPEDKLPLPPSDAKVFTTCCDYCIIGCGYKVYRWPKGRDGGPKAHQNAFGVDFPVGPLSGKWPSPNMHNTVMVDGKPHSVIVIPDGDIKAVNLMGDHSPRGGPIAQKCYNPMKPTADRLRHPMIRVGENLLPVSWDMALDVTAEISKYILEKYGEHAWGMKQFSYHFFENTYALTKLALRHIKTPFWAHHDKSVGSGSDTPGLKDAGIDPFSASYEDWSDADVLFMSGTDCFETHTALFNVWIMRGVARGMKLIHVLPRKTTGMAYGEKHGGLNLLLDPGTDTVLQLALARIILENGWEDKEFIRKWVANTWEIGSGFGQGVRNTRWQWRTTKWGTDFKGYKKWILSYKFAELERASKICGIPADQIYKTAEMLAKPVDGKRPKTSFMLEKGMYWSNNYTNTASFAALGLLCGAGNRPGQVISRAGGHQRGMIPGGSYPLNKSPEKYPGRRRKDLDFNRWFEAGNARFIWVVGTTWLQAMAGTQALADACNRATCLNPHQIESLDKEHIIEVLKKRVDSGGTVIVDQDIYPIDPIGTKYADIVLPAAGWGEDTFTRANGERRIRIYEKFYDPPGEAKPDWWIVAKFAKKMGFKGFDWKDSNDVFEEAARFSRKRRLAYYPLVWLAKRQGRRGHDLLREYGTTGIQAPIRYEDGKLVGTKRLHDPTLELGTPQGPTVHQKWLHSFGSQSGKALLIKSPWELFEDFFEFMKPKGDELWVTNGRINERWNSGYDDERRPYIVQRWPDNFLEIHPDDAKARGIESGDFVSIESDKVPVQTGGYIGVQGDDHSFTKLMEAGNIKLTMGSFTAVAIVTDGVKPGVTFTYFLHKTSPANNITPRVPDPISDRPRFKIARGVVKKTGESPYKKSFRSMTFASRTII